jgi:hypothetical protein
MDYKTSKHNLERHRMARLQLLSFAGAKVMCGLELQLDCAPFVLALG